MNQTAQGLAALGRGPDTQLVHMAPGEVRSLQQLAMAHGGSLTINPETGLPEAGFLSSILPMLIGGGLTIASGGALSPVMAGLLTGGATGLATGSLKKGLMAGFGAYGGAGLGSALAGAGGANMAAAGGVNAANLAGPAVPPIEAFNPSNLAGSSSPGMFGNAAANFSKAGAGITGLGSEAGRGAFMSQIGGGKGLGMAGLAAAAPMLMDTTTKQPEIKTDANMGQRYSYAPGAVGPTLSPDVPGYGNQGQNFGQEQTYFRPQYAQIDNEAARKLYGFAAGGPVEAMSNANAIGMNTGYPQANIRTGAYATPYQQPMAQNVVTGAQDAAVDPYTGQATFATGGSINLQGTFDVGGGQAGGQSGSSTAAPEPFLGNNNSPSMPQTHRVQQPPMFQDARYRGGDGFTPMPGADFMPGIGNPAGLQGLMKNRAFAEGGETMAGGGVSDLGSYSDGGRLLRGPGDGVSDDIPAMIGKKQPARLADGEFVVPARIVSELGNGSTEAGARKLYAMMDRVQKARKKTVGKGKVAANSRSAKYLPA